MKISAICSRCGAPAKVHALTGYRSGKPVHAHFCLKCADSAYEEFLGAGSGPSRPRSRPSAGTLLILAGVLLALVGAVAGRLPFGGSAGFGMVQQIGGIVGVVLVLLGAVLRVDLVVVVGTVVIGLAVIGDFLGGAGGASIAKMLLSVGGLALGFAGLGLRRMRRGE